MKPSIQFWNAFGIALCALATTNPTRAQIVPDATLPQNSSVTAEGNASVINGGTRAGTNLFHSFEQFSVPTNGVAFFNNALDIQNIISRVTGSSVSNIDGLIRAKGTANLFLLNPNGIIFGPNARLNIGGSFLASTASAVNFSDGIHFSATAHPSTPLLTVSVPIGLQFGGTAGRILIQGPGNNLRVASNRAFDRGENPGGLQVRPGKTLGLVGGDVTLEGGNLIADGGRIEVGSVAGSSLVSLTPTDFGWSLGYSGVPSFQDIQLSRRASVDASGEGGGNIQVQGRRVTLTDGSAIFALTSGSKPGGTVTVNASDSVEIIGTSADHLFPSAMFTDTQSAGSAGDLTINTGALQVLDGAVVTAESFGVGNAGNLLVNADTSVTLSETGSIAAANGEQLNSRSGLSTTTRGAGAAGDLTITTRALLVENGAVVRTDSFGTGNAGNLTVNASDSVKLSGQSGLFAQVGRRAMGNGGNLTIETGQLLVQNGAVVSTANLSTGTGGNLTLKAHRLIVQDRARIAATTLSGNGGNITLQLQDLLLLRRNSNISTTVYTAGAGGNINIDADLIVAVPSENSDITANSFEGNGGTINITAQGIFGLVQRDLEELKTLLGTDDPKNLIPARLSSSDITAISQTDPSLRGQVNINRLDFDPTQGLVTLPEEVVDVSRLIAQGCSAGEGPAVSQFVITGRGGLPPSPSEALSSDTVWSDLRMPTLAPRSPLRDRTENREASAISTNPTSSTLAPIVEAQGWVIGANGEVILTAQAPTVTAHTPWLTSASCHTPAFSY